MRRLPELVFSCRCVVSSRHEMDDRALHFTEVGQTLENNVFMKWVECLRPDPNHAKHSVIVNFQES